MWMWYHTKINEVLLFEGLKVETVGVLLFTCFMVILVAVFLEFIKHLNKRSNQSTNDISSKYGGLSISQRKSSHLYRTFLHFFQLLIGYCLMNVYMSFSIWICLSICFGLTLGYWIFERKSKLIV